MTRRVLTGTGTPEASWRAGDALERLPRTRPGDLLGAGPVLVLAPHPDDEVLGAGGVLAELAAAGRHVTLLALTDGEGSHTGSPTLGPGALAARRRGERTAALDALGLAGAPVAELGVPDGAVEEHEESVADAVADALADLDGPATCLAPRSGDGHPDHDAAARAAGRACAGTGTRRVGYGVWFWHWADPGEPDLAAARRVDLGAPARRAKADAVACFTTQIAPLSPDPRDAAVLPPPVLERLLRGFEVFW